MKKLLLGLVVAISLAAQVPSQCGQTGNLTAANTNGTVINNTTVGCTYWRLTYYTNTSGISISIQGAIGQGASFSNMTIVSGSSANPDTTTGSDTVLVFGYFPFVQVAVTTLTGGQVWYTLQGQNGPNSASISSAANTYSGQTLTLAPPYFKSNGNFYTSTGYQAVLPSSSPTWINAVTPTVVTGANGDITFAGTGQYFATLTAATSAEIEFVLTTNSIVNVASGQSVGVWLWDSTNNFIYTWEAGSNETVTTGSTYCFIELVKWTYAGSGNPSISSTLGAFDVPCVSPWHLKMSLSAGTITASQSLNGGKNFYNITTVGSIGTVTKGGYMGLAGGIYNLFADVFSISVI